MGDRAIGKTSMLVALADTSTAQIVHMVKPNPDKFRREHGRKRKIYLPTPSDPNNFLLEDVDDGPPAGTDELKEEKIELRVDLPSGRDIIPFQCFDTPGEAWDNPKYSSIQPKIWSQIEERISKSTYVLLFMPPHKKMIDPVRVVSSPTLINYLDVEELLDLGKWKAQLSSRLDFLWNKCPKLKYVLLCLHKADCFCDVDQIGTKWRYKPRGGNNWTLYCNSVQQEFLSDASEIIADYSEIPRKPRIRPFVTSTLNRSMLELPWIYLASLMA